jgi:hypothetical protein
MKLFRRALLGILLILLLALGLIWFNRPQRVDMANLAPASALVFLESNSLMEVADGIVATNTWKSVKPLVGEAKTDWPNVQVRRLIAFTGIGPTSSVILARAQVAIVMLDLGSREQDDTMTLKPEVALLIETHTSKRRIKVTVENALQTFAQRLYRNPTSKRVVVDGDEFLVWTAADGDRQIVAIIDDTVVIVANSDRAAKACLEARRGLRPNLRSDPELAQMKTNLSADDSLAFGFVPSSRAPELLALLTPVALGRAPGDAQIDGLVARSAAKIFSSAGWTAKLVDGNIEDHYFFTLKSAVVSRMRPALEPAGKSAPPATFVAEGTQSFTVYSFKQPDQTWHELQTTLSTQLDTLSAVLLTSVLKSGLTPYGIDDPRSFLKLVGPEIVTLRFNANEASSVLIARIRDESGLRELLKHSASQVSEEGERKRTVHYQDGFVLMGIEEDVERCVQAAAGHGRAEMKHLGREPATSIVTYSRDSQRVSNFISAVARAQNTIAKVNDATTLEQYVKIPYSVTETSLTEYGLDRRTRSPFGQFGALVTLLFPPDLN